MVLEKEKTGATRERVSTSAKPPKQKPGKALIAFIVILLLLIAVETGIIVAQSQANKRIETQAEQALGKFLKSGEQAVTGEGTDLLMRNVRFCWSKQICINTNRLTGTAVPLGKQSVVNFDELSGFMVNVRNATVQISPETLQGMFNESVFNYPGSNLRDLKVGIRQAGNRNNVMLNGSLKYLFLWIPFEMDTNLSVDRKTNTLVIAVNTLNVFGIIPATWLIEFKPFNLDKLLTLPPNRHLTVHQNLMMVKPFGLFPPPRVDGTISDIAVTPKLISLTFSGSDKTFQTPPDSAAPNSVYLEGGSTQFGKLGMINTQLQVIDGNPGNPFQLSLLNYRDYLPKSNVKLLPNDAVQVIMPDHNLPSEPALKPQPPAPTPGRVTRQKLEAGKDKVETGKDKVGDFIEKTKEKTKDILGL